MAKQMCKEMVEAILLKKTHKSFIFKELNRMSDETLRNHEILFRGFDEKFKRINTELTFDIFRGAVALVLDDTLNWGKIVTIFAFLKRVKDGQERVKEYKKFISSSLSGWIETNGGWNGFLIFAHHPPTASEVLYGVTMIFGAGVLVGGLVMSLFK